MGEEALQISFAQRIRIEGWSVRTTEQEVQAKVRAEDGEMPASGGTKRTLNQQIASLQQEFRSALGTKVDIKQTAKGRGKIVIQFRSHDEFERLRSLLVGEIAPPERKAG